MTDTHLEPELQDWEPYGPSGLRRGAERIMLLASGQWVRYTIVPGLRNTHGAPHFDTREEAVNHGV